MKYVNFLSSQKDVSLKALRLLILIMAPLTPYLAEELWSLSNGSMNQSVHLQKWPEYDKELVKEDLVTIVVQVNGKIRDKLKVPTFALGASHRLIQPRLPRDASAGKHSSQLTAREEIIKKAEKSERVQKYLEGRKIQKTIFVPGKLVNFVV